MKKIFDKNTCCTDPDSLQFCLPVSEHEFWYCQPDTGALLSCPEESLIHRKYLGNPKKLLEDAKIETAVMAFLQNRQVWLSGEIDVRDFSEEEQRELLSDYGYGWNDFDNDADRNQIICEIYFESFPMDFSNSI